MSLTVPNLTIQKPVVEMGLIQGQQPGSINEYNFSVALEKLKLEYMYQYQMGMMGVRGSQRIDFLVFVAPASAACYIQGTYWHRAATAGEDRLKHAIAEHYFGAGNVFDFSEEETETVETAIVSIRKKLL